MSVDQAHVTQSTQDVAITGSTAVTVAATAPTPAKAAQAVQDVVGSGGIIGTLQTDLQGNPNVLFIGAGVILVALLAAFGYLLVAAVSANSGIAQHYLAVIFSNGVVWAVVAGVLVGGAWLLPQQSPLQKP